MFRSDDDSIHSVDRIDASREHADGKSQIRIPQSEIDKRALGSSDPIALSLHNCRSPAVFDRIESVNQLVRIFCRLQKPLFERFLRNRISASPAQTTTRL